MSRDDIVGGAKQMFGTNALIRAGFQSCDDNFTEIYEAFKTLDLLIPAHASKTIYNLFIANGADWEVLGIKVVPDVAQGGTLTGTFVKAASTTAPAAATTPLHSGTANFNGTAHTVQSLTLTETAADLLIDDGQRIGLVLSAALSTGSARVSILLGRR